MSVTTKTFPFLLPFFLSLSLSRARKISDAFGDLDASTAGSVHEEEAIVEEQKDEGKLGFCEIQWQQNPPFEDGRKFTKKNFKRLDEPPLDKLNPSKLNMEDDDRVQIIPLTSPMKVRSPLGYRSSYNIGDNPTELSVVSKIAPVHQTPSIKTLSHPRLPPEPSPDHRKSSLLSLRSLSISLRMLKNRGRSDSFETVEPSSMLETIDETSARSIFKMDMFERNLKKFVTKSNESDFQNYSEYSQSQQTIKNKPKTYFKNQKVYARRSSMSDVHEQNPHPKTLQQHSNISHSSHSVKHEAAKKKEEHKKASDKTAEMLKEVRKRNLETAKRISAPRRISTAY